MSLGLSVAGGALIRFFYTATAPGGLGAAVVPGGWAGWSGPGGAVSPDDQAAPGDGP